MNSIENPILIDMNITMCCKNIYLSHPFMTLKKRLFFVDIHYHHTFIINDISGWTMNGWIWMIKWAQKSKKEYCWNIIMPHGFTFCDVANCSLMKPTVFSRIDKHLCVKTTILLFESYLFVQMVLVICNINVRGFWRMEMLDSVKDLK